MPNERQLEVQIALARTDLERHLVQLQTVVRETLDVRRRARTAFERARRSMRSFVERNIVVAAVAATLVGAWLARRRR